jgi:predicted nucleic acid-binding protein
MGGRAYVDSNILIYAIEGEAPLKALAASALEQLIREGRSLVTSELTVGECLAGALRHDRKLAEAYLDLFERANLLETADVTRPLVRRAAELGARFNMKLLDALHVATAEANGCEVFLTNDRGIRAPAGIELRGLTGETGVYSPPPSEWT